MRVRLLQAATVPAHGDWPEGHWFPAGAEVEIPDEHFDPALHQALIPLDAKAPEAVTQDEDARWADEVTELTKEDDS